MPVMVMARARCAAAGLLVLLCGLGFTTSSFGHGAPGASVKARVDAMPELLEVISAQIHITVTAQIVVENHDDRVLEILDDDGRAFLRISRSGVQADTHAPAFYRTRAPTQGERLPKALAEANGDMPARWQHVSDAPAWGWFDPRIDGDDMDIPHAAEHSSAPTRLADWQIPVRFGGEPSRLAGSFYYEPLQPGRFVSKLQGSVEIADGVQVGIAQAPVPSMHIRNASDQPVTVIGRKGQPWLRIDDGIYRNVTLDADEDAVRWVRIGAGQRHSWTESRAGYPERSPPHALLHEATGGTKLADWEVPVLVGDVPHFVRGEVWWYPDVD